jgi:predicted nuclease with TOPRIM domain
MLQQLQGELVSLREKYAVLKKRVQQAEKENDDLFADNTRIEKQLALCRNQLRHYQDAPKQITPPKRS